MKNHYKFNLALIIIVFILSGCGNKDIASEYKTKAAIRSTGNNPALMKGKNSTAQKFADDARKAYKRKEYKKAIELYEKALEIEKNDFWYFDLGNCYYFTKEYNNAVRTFRDISHDFPKIGFAYYNAACCYSLLERSTGFRYIDLAIEYGFNDKKLLAEDPDLAYLRQFQRFDRYFPMDTKRKNISPEFSTKYNQETLVFEYIDIPENKKGKFALVASRKAFLFDEIKLEKDEDTSALKKIVKIPFGTILEIGESIGVADPEYCDDLFEFEKELNYFYKTSFNGKSGLVWGADLTGDNLCYSDLVRLKYYYEKEIKSDSFMPFIGYRNLTEKQMSSLEQHHISAELVKPSEYSVYANRPDDFISLYLKKSNLDSLFITTDFFIHCYHLLFDNMLQEIEITILLGRVQKLVDNFLNALSDRSFLETLPAGTVENVNFLKDYFSVAKILLGMTPPLSDYLNSFDTYIDNGAISLPDLSGYSSTVKFELKYIIDGKGPAKSPLFGSNTDYSLFKPRGHYTKNNFLKAYFRGMYWLGGMNFDLDPQNYNASKFTEALIISSILKNRIKTYDLWKSIYDPITFLISSSNTISFYDINNYLKKSGDTKISSLLSAGENAVPAIQEILAGKEQDKMKFNPLQNLAKPENEVMPKGFRLLSQRFTLDSFIHRLLSFPETADRPFVSGTDVAASFGNTLSTDVLLAENSGNYSSQLDKIRKTLKNTDSEFWKSSFYNTYLATIRSMASFDSTQPYFFCKDFAWDSKNLAAMLGSWAELRHDTILYVEQCCAECGGIPRDPTYRIEEMPMIVHFIEPNINFFYTLQNSVLSLSSLLESFYIMIPMYRNKLSDFNSILNAVIAIVEKEVTNTAITQEENQKITSIPWDLISIVIPAEDSHYLYGNDDQYRQALIADVFTNFRTGEVLEVGTGTPVRLFVALNDGQGGKRIATGYAYSYYEFIQPPGDRLNDEDWKTLVYDENKDLSNKMPEWERKYLD